MKDKCSDCGGLLEKGVLLDSTYGGVLAQRYAKADMPDAPDAKLMMFLESKFTDLRRITARRCLSCNRIFLYAQNTVTVQNMNKKILNRFLIIIVIMIVVVLVSYFLAS